MLSPGLLELRAWPSSGLVWQRKSSRCTQFKVGRLVFIFSHMPVHLLGQICCRKEITYFKSSQVLKTSSQDFKTFSLQPKLILLAISLLFLLGIIYFYTTAKKKTKSHKIPRHRQTLITLKEHSILLAIFLVVMLFEESVAGFIEFHYTQLGPSGAFWVWWTQVFLGYSVTSIVLPALCLRFVKLFYRRSSVWFASINALAINQYALPGAV